MKTINKTKAVKPATKVKKAKKPHVCRFEYFTRDEEHDIFGCPVCFTIKFNLPYAENMRFGLNIKENEDV